MAMPRRMGTFFALVLNAMVAFHVTQVTFALPDDAHNKRIGALAKLSPEDLVRVLHDVGYRKAKVGLRMFPDTGRKSKRSVRHSCHNLSLTAKTSASKEHFESNPLYGSTQRSIERFRHVSLIEMNERHGISIEDRNTRADTDSATDANKDLDCECEPYTCSCHKQCFCRLTGDPFKGIHYPPNANCPVCPSCPSEGDKSKEENEEEGASSAKQAFKCSCSFEGIGGAGISNGGYMECDCKVADCSCSKECACKLKNSENDGKLSFKESQRPTLESQEDSTQDKEVSGQGQQPSKTEIKPSPNSRRTPLRANSILRVT